MLIILEGTSGQESALDVFDIAAIFPAAQKGSGPEAIPVLGVSMVQIKGGGQVIVKEGVRSLTERVNAARRVASLLAGGGSDRAARALEIDAVDPPKRLL